MDMDICIYVRLIASVMSPQGSMCRLYQQRLHKTVQVTHRQPRIILIAPFAAAAVGAAIVHYSVYIGWPA